MARLVKLGRGMTRSLACVQHWVYGFDLIILNGRVLRWRMCARHLRERMCIGSGKKFERTIIIIVVNDATTTSCNHKIFRLSLSIDTSQQQRQRLKLWAGNAIFVFFRFFLFLLDAKIGFTMVSVCAFAAVAVSDEEALIQYVVFLFFCFLFYNCIFMLFKIHKALPACQWDSYAQAQSWHVQSRWKLY